MGVKVLHEHPDKPGSRCYEIRGDSCGNLTKVHLLMIGSREFAVAWHTYAWTWYVYDTETGKQVGSMTREMFDAFKSYPLGLLSLSEMQPAPECVQ